MCKGGCSFVCICVQRTTWGMVLWSHLPCASNGLSLMWSLPSRWASLVSTCFHLLCSGTGNRTGFFSWVLALRPSCLHSEHIIDWALSLALHVFLRLAWNTPPICFGFPDAGITGVCHQVGHVTGFLSSFMSKITGSSWQLPLGYCWPVITCDCTPWLWVQFLGGYICHMPN